MFWPGLCLTIKCSALLVFCILLDSQRVRSVLAVLDDTLIIFVRNYEWWRQ